MVKGRFIGFMPASVLRGGRRRDFMIRTQENYVLGMRDLLAAGISSAQEWLLDCQATDGHWCAELEGDTILESEYLIYLHFIDKLDSESLRKATNYIRSKMLPEGGMTTYPGGPFEMSASV